MKLQFPLSVGALIVSFGALGCQVSNSELASRPYGGADSDAAVGLGDAGAGSSNSAPAAGSSATGGTGGDNPTTYNSDGGTAGDAPTGGSGGTGGSTASTAGNGGAGGAGGDSSMAGTGGTGGTGGGSSTAGTGGTGGTGGGSSTAGTGGTGGAGGSGSSCPTDYTMATHIVINVSWDGTYALTKGSGQVHVWTKSHFVESGDSATVESQSCGSALPPITTTVLAGSEKILPEIPDAAWDATTMPTFSGTATKSGDTVTVDPGVVLVGLTMSNPTATWPKASDIMTVDHDDDGLPGITAIPKQDSGYKAPPVNLSRSSRADKLYLAIRNIMTFSATVVGCPDTYSGTTDVQNFENHIVGCHVLGGSECTSTQSQFVDDNRTVYNLGSATFTSQRVDANASCADVRAAVPN